MHFVGLLKEPNELNIVVPFELMVETKSTQIGKLFTTKKSLTSSFS